LVFEVTFEHDEDMVFFAFSQPYTYGQIVSEILDKEELIKPAQANLIQVINKPRPQPQAQNPAFERQQTMPVPVHEKPSMQRA
jgi:hypothetical protein